MITKIALEVLAAQYPELSMIQGLQQPRVSTMFRMDTRPDFQSLVGRDKNYALLNKLNPALGGEAALRYDASWRNALTSNVPLHEAYQQGLLRGTAADNMYTQLQQGRPSSMLTSQVAQAPAPAPMQAPAPAPQAPVQAPAAQASVQRPGMARPMGGSSSSAIMRRPVQGGMGTAARVGRAILTRGRA